MFLCFLSSFQAHASDCSRHQTKPRFPLQSLASDIEKGESGTDSPARELHQRARRRISSDHLAHVFWGGEHEWITGLQVPSLIAGWLCKKAPSTLRRCWKPQLTGSS